MEGPHTIALPESRLPSFQDRRREPRKLGHGAVVVNTLGLIRRRRVAAVIDYSLTGIRLQGDLRGLAIGTMAEIQFTGGGSSVSARVKCRWFNFVSAGILQSGWVVPEENRGILFDILESLPYSEKMPVIKDRRERVQRRRPARFDNPLRNSTERRLVDTLPISPLVFYEQDLQFLRRQDRRQCNERAGPIPPQGDNRKATRRSPAPRPIIVHKHTIVVTAWKILLALRDLGLFMLPRFICSRLMNEGGFAFVAHPRDTDDIQRQFPLFKFFPEKVLNFWLKYQWPVAGPRIHGVQDRFGHEIKGWLIFCPLTARQMIRDRDLAKRRVISTVALAGKMGLKLVGLGAFTSIVTRDGLDVVDRHAPNVTTGNALSAAGALQNVAAGCHLVGLRLSDATAAIVGAAGNVGSACARLLAPAVKRLILVDVNQQNVRALFNELSGTSVSIEMSGTTDSLIQADIVIAVTNAPGAIVRAEHLKPGAVVVDAAQPKNVADKVPQQRADVLVMDSCIYRFPGIDYAFDLGIGSGEALGCMAETIVLAAAGGCKNYSIGKLSPEQVVDVYTAARLLGVKIGYFRTSSGFVDENRLRAVREARGLLLPGSFN